MIVQKKGFLLRDFVVVGILFGLIVALYIIQVASLADNYNNQDIISPSFSDHYNKLQNNLNQMDTSLNSVKGGQGLNLIGTFNVAFNSVFTVFAMVIDGIFIYTGMANNLAGDFSFLDKTTVLLFTTAVIAILATYIVFIWLSSISRGKI